MKSASTTNVNYQNIRQQIKQRRQLSNDIDNSDEISKLTRTIHLLEKQLQNKDTAIDSKDMEIQQLKTQIKQLITDPSKSLVIQQSTTFDHFSNSQKLAKPTVDQSSVKHQKEKLIEYKLQKIEALTKTALTTQRNDELFNVTLQQQSQISDLKKQIEQLENNPQIKQLQTQKNEIEEIQTLNKELQQQIQKLQQKIQVQEEQSAQLKEENLKNEQLVQDMNQQIQDLRKSETSVKQLNVQLNNKIQEINQLNYQLKRDLNKMSVDYQIGAITDKNATFERLSQYGQDILNKNDHTDSADALQLFYQTKQEILKNVDMKEVSEAESSSEEVIKSHIQPEQEKPEENTQEIKQSITNKSKSYTLADETLPAIKKGELFNNISVLQRLEQQLVNNEQFIKNRTKILNEEKSSQRVFSNQPQQQSIIGVQGNDVAKLQQVQHTPKCQIDSFLPELQQETPKMREYQLDVK